MDWSIVHSLNGFLFRTDPAYAAKAARVSALARDITEVLAAVLRDARKHCDVSAAAIGTDEAAARSAADGGRIGPGEWVRCIDVKAGRVIVRQVARPPDLADIDPSELR